MHFDWRAFCVSHGVPFIDSGPNVKRGEINISCPFCGGGDPSMHMGLHDERGFACWRNQGHVGRRPQRLIRVLLGCSWERACEIAGLSATPMPGSTDELRARLKPKVTPPLRIRPLEFPPEFRRISEGRRLFWDYLLKRGFDDPGELGRLYRLRCASQGRFAQRLVLPVLVGRKVIGWTARAVGRSKARYLAFPDDVPVIKRFLFNHDALAEGGRALILVEGPVDALKVDYYGRSLGVRAVGAMGLALTPPQISALVEGGQRFDRVCVAVDQGAEGSGLRIASMLSLLHPRLLRVEGYKDPGEMPPIAARNFAKAALL